MVPRKPGIHPLILAEEQLKFFLHVPENYRQNEPAPLVFALHWGGPATAETPLVFLEGFRMIKNCGILYLGLHLIWIQIFINW